MATATSRDSSNNMGIIIGALAVVAILIAAYFMFMRNPNTMDTSMDSPSITAGTTTSGGGTGTTTGAP